MNSVPLVSIVIPAYNPRFFQGALHSALSQDYAHFEVVVCDDSGGDEIKNIVDLFEGVATMPLRYVRNSQRMGFIGNVLQCLGQARGEFVKFLCDDDHLFPACIRYQAQALIDHDDINLVVAQRNFWDADGIVLPTRLENSPLARSSCVFKGSDLLEIFEGFPVNFLGGFSASLFRRSDLEQFLPALTTPGQCFAAQLDLALYICLLRRGNMAVLNQILSAERLYPERLSRQQPMREALGTEMQWLVSMLKARGSESAPAKGWVRIVDMGRAGESPRPWEELALSRALGNIQTTQSWKVGCDTESFGEFYAQWLACRNFSPLHEALLPDRLAGWSCQPRILPVILDRDEGGASLRDTLESLQAQLYPPEMVLVLSANCERARLDERVLYMPLQEDGSAQLNQTLAQLDTVQWFYLLRSGDRLVKSALLMLAERVATDPALRCVYSDEGALRAGESAEPVFKPDFNLDLLRSYPYVGRALAFERDALLALGGFNPDFAELAPHDMLWRLVEGEGADCIGHIAEIVLESRLTYPQWLATAQVREQDGRVVQAHLSRLNVPSELRHDTAMLGNRIDYLHDDQPLVSIIVVLKDQLAALQRCVETVLERTTYGHYELLIVDGGSEQPDTRNWLAGIEQWGGDKVRVLDARQHAASSLGQHKGAAIGAIDMQPQTVGVPHACELRQGVHRAHRSAARIGHDEEGTAPRGYVVRDASLQGIHVHLEAVGVGDHADLLRPQARRAHRLHHRVVGLGGGVADKLTKIVRARPLSCRNHTAEVGDGPAAREQSPGFRVVEAHPETQPAQHRHLELNQGRRGLPDAGVAVHHAGEQVSKGGVGQAAPRNEGEVARRGGVESDRHHIVHHAGEQATKGGGGLGHRLHHPTGGLVAAICPQHGTFWRGVHPG